VIDFRRGLAAAKAELRPADAEPDEPPRPKYLVGLFPQQAAFVADKAKKKAAICSRRAGKTEGVASWLLDGADSCPGGMSVYIARSRNNARLILWNTLVRMNRRLDLGLRFREIDQQLIVETPNEHRIWLSGCKDRSEIDKFRGIGGTRVAGIRRAAIDEAQAFPEWLPELVDDVLEPALLDQDGELCMVGTPAPIPAGLFYTATTGDGGPLWSTHHWTVLANPFIPHAGTWLADKRDRNKWDDKHPTYVREWLGQWVLDRGALVYPYDSAINSFLELPEGEWLFGLGVDLGYDVNGTAFVAVAFRRNHPEIYVLECETWTALIPTAIEAHILAWEHRYKKERGRGFSSILADAGGLGVMVTQQMRENGIPVEDIKKTDKRGHIELVAGDLKSGTIKIHPHGARKLLQEIQVLPWDEDHEAPDERFQDHAADAFLYACRGVRPWYRPEQEEPKPGSPEWYAREQRKWKAAAAKRVRELQRRRAGARR
jgi:hypothetical protein